ncbi:Prolamin-like domain-containing protein [Hirschfeldia incana]|nr:Prolamin-like domain-containing protein [Hirschfeldia incana]
MAYTTSRITIVFIVVAFVCAFVPAFSVEDAEAKSLWNTCLLKISPKCALDVIGVVFENGTITDACCQDLVQEGKMCHDSLIKYIAERPLLVSHETQYLKKSGDLWTHCVSISQTA